MSRLNPKASLAMKAAWAMARKGRVIFGGTVRQYMREALRLAWADVKAHSVTKAYDELRADLAAKRKQPARSAPTAYLARFANSTHRHIWAGSRL